MNAEEKRYLNRAEVLGCQDLRLVDVEVPEWGGWVRVCAMNSTDQAKFDAECTPEDPNKMRAWMVVFMVVDARGKRIFRDSDIPRLMEKSGAAMDRIWEAASKLHADETARLLAMADRVAKSMPRAPGEAGAEELAARADQNLQEAMASGKIGG